MLFGGSDGGPQGPRWPIHGPLPHVRWVEKRKGPFGSLERVLLVLTKSIAGNNLPILNIQQPPIRLPL